MAAAPPPPPGPPQPPPPRPGPPINRDIPPSLRGARDASGRPICPIPTCARTFTAPGRLTNHILRIHHAISPFPCPACKSTSFNTKRSLQLHINNIHSTLPAAALQCLSSRINRPRQVIEHAPPYPLGLARYEIRYGGFRSIRNPEGYPKLHQHLHDLDADSSIICHGLHLADRAKARDWNYYNDRSGRWERHDYVADPVWAAQRGIVGVLCNRSTCRCGEVWPDHHEQPGNLGYCFECPAVLYG